MSTCKEYQPPTKLQTSGSKAIGGAILVGNWFNVEMYVCSVYIRSDPTFVTSTISM